jgi:hypothetical protein
MAHDDIAAAFFLVAAVAFAGGVMIVICRPTSSGLMQEGV